MKFLLIFTAAYLHLSSARLCPFRKINRISNKHASKIPTPRSLSSLLSASTHHFTLRPRKSSSQNTKDTIQNIPFPKQLLALPLISCMQLLPTITPLPPWIPRKCVHIGIGSLLISSDIHNKLLRRTIYASTLLACVSFPFPRVFSFARNQDVGILGYTTIASLCAHLHIPFRAVAPMFYADPAGAIVGRTLPRSLNPIIFGKKTLAGTLAVSLVSFLTTDDILLEKARNATIIPLIELFGGKFDNSFIGMYLIFRYMKNTKTTKTTHTNTHLPDTPSTIEHVIKDTML